VVVSSYIRIRQYRSPLRVVAATLLRSRESITRRLEKCKKRIAELCKQGKQQESLLQQAKDEAEALRRQLRELRFQVQTLENQPVRLPIDPVLPCHHYGPTMVALSINLARNGGLRSAESALQLFHDAYGITGEVPHWTTIRTWMQRVGVAAIDLPLEAADDWVWMADHSCQIGNDKVLVVLAVRASKMPPPGTALKHEDLHVLIVQPGTQWKTEDVAKAYEKLAEKYGVPMALVVDGAPELRDAAEVLQKQRPEMIVLNDFKHKAANIMKATVGKDEQFTKFNSLVGSTRNAVQQTELAHLRPPSSKPKSRFMNLAAILHWAAMVMWLLDHPEAKGRAGITDERFAEKLGWVREFSEGIAIWNECQDVVSAGVTFMNEQGLFRGATEALRACMGQTSSSMAAEVRQRLLEFTQESEKLLSEGQRLPISTEILESSFGLYKQLERQHSKGGFTSLLAAFGSLLRPVSPQSVKRALLHTPVKKMRAWVSENLGSTLTSKRQTAYKEFANAT
jgi:hypothetical protein